MKQLRKKNIFQLTVILMVTYMGIGFISCGSDDDNNYGCASQRESSDVT